MFLDSNISGTCDYIHFGLYARNIRSDNIFVIFIATKDRILYLQNKILPLQKKLHFHQKIYGQENIVVLYVTASIINVIDFFYLFYMQST